MEFTKALLSCLKNLNSHEDEVYSDITVEVENETFPCHKFILSACSSFFRTLFRCPVQGTKHNSVHLDDISSETFRLIYRFIYLHEYTLNDENVLDVWKAADALQFDFIVSACRKLVMETLNEKNCYRYFCHAKLLGKNVIGQILDYITSNFDLCTDSGCIMELEGHILLTIVRDPNLKSSGEENVVDAILKWAGQTTTSLPEIMPDSANLRCDYLVPLLSVSRLASLSEDYLRGLLLHRLISDNMKARDLIMQVLMYRMGCRPTYWPTFAGHRKSSGWDDVVLMQSGVRNIIKFSLTEKKMIGIIDIAKLPENAVMNEHNSEPYVCGFADNINDTLSVFLLVQGQWQSVASLHLGYGMYQRGEGGHLQTAQQTLISFSVADRVHIVHTSSGDIFTWNPVNRTDLKRMTSVPSEMPVIHVTPYNSSIIAISGDADKSAVLNVFDTTVQEWGTNVTLQGVVDQNISTFQKGDKLYLLTSCGEIYLIDIGMGGATTNHVTTFANFKNSLIGALVYCEDLYVFVRECALDVCLDTYPTFLEFPELLNQVHVIGAPNPCKSLIPTSVPK